MELFSCHSSGRIYNKIKICSINSKIFFLACFELCKQSPFLENIADIVLHSPTTILVLYRLEIITPEHDQGATIHQHHKFFQHAAFRF